MINPEAGDIAWIEFGDTRGTEQSGRRPGLILSGSNYHQRSPRAVVCPITTNESHWPLDVALPKELRTRGVVLVDQVRTIDRGARLFRIIERAPTDLLAEVKAVLMSLLSLRLSEFEPLR